jgi:hypothetical protein
MNHAAAGEMGMPALGEHGYLARGRRLHETRVG